MLVAPIKQGEGAIEHESPTGLIRFHQHGWGLLDQNTRQTSLWLGVK